MQPALSDLQGGAGGTHPFPTPPASLWSLASECPLLAEPTQWPEAWEPVDRSTQASPQGLEQVGEGAKVPALSVSVCSSLLLLLDLCS